MKILGKIVRLGVLLMVGWGLILPAPVTARAPQDQEFPPGPDRFHKVTVQYTAYIWWLARWDTNEIVCTLSVEHEGIPTNEEIEAQCGEDVFEEWEKTGACSQDGTCGGLYFHPVSTEESQKEVVLELPPATVEMSLDNCALRPDRGCSTRPSLLLKGLEPLPNEQITSIGGTVNGQPFSCPGNECRFALSETDPQGVKLTFWAYSTYGDSTEIFTALLRVAVGQPEDSPAPVWYVDAYSSQWMGIPPASCAEVWGVFPDPGNLPEWLYTPLSVEEMASDEPFSYLAGNLINKGVVDASFCADGGLTSDGAATPCGLDTARVAVTNWQNQFDSIILSVSRETGVPAALLKNMFSRESQFWPSATTVDQELTDVGFGQLTQNGADTTLLWNQDFYNEFCPLVLLESTCSQGYALLTMQEQETLRSALVQSVDVSCADCPLGLDFTKMDESITVFAETLAANCRQADQVIEETTGLNPGQAVTYNDMWNFTLVNYNAGPGCLTSAVRDTYYAGLPLTWENLAPMLQTGCEGAIDYVNDVTQ